MCYRMRDIYIATASVAGLLLVLVIAVITICLCKEKHNAEKANQKLRAKMAGLEETVVSVSLI